MKCPVDDGRFGRDPRRGTNRPSFVDDVLDRGRDRSAMTPRRVDFEAA